jgi:SAM-dependent methyltransferase
MNIRRRVFKSLYGHATDDATLPWHRDEPSPTLVRALDARGGPGRALDLGCGEGVSAVYLAERGYDVVAIDFVSAALELTRARARRAGVELELLRADVLDYAPAEPFDVVLDSGCLHHIAPGGHERYRRGLDRWLQPDGDYVLVHFGKRHAFDWRPFGPRRATRAAIEGLCAPLRLVAYEETVFELDFPVGNSIAGVYWFRR